MTPRERWEQPTPAEMLEMSLHAERGPMVVEDLRRLPSLPLIVAEGTTVSPSGVVDRARAVWLLPTPALQRSRLEERRLEPRVMELYRLIAAEIECEARESAMPVVTVDPSSGIDETLAAVEEHFAGALAAGPRAETIGERKALLREANEAIVRQVRGYYARAWAEGDADEVVRTFHCECGDAGCVLVDDVRICHAAAHRVVAPAHT
jgi:hypothetical protein